MSHFWWAVEWKPQDLWIGVYWKRTKLDALLPASKMGGFIDVWICLVPMVPIHLAWEGDAPE